MQLRKRFNVFFLIFGFLISFSVFAESLTYELKIDGMSCPFCSYGVEKKLKEVEGVESVEVNIGKGTVLVKMKPNVILTKEQATKAVKNAGFPLSSFKQKKGD